MVQISFTDTANQITKIGYIEQEKKEDKKIEVIPYFDQLKVRKLYGGLQILNTSSGVNAKVGEIYLIKSGGSKRICARFEGLTVSASLT